ncbi:MAG: hypothetical protein K9N09_04320 [Candidatus Cloacimonetes bacterium]|nr:hypothetical protein [Candidatus Cloacimonadota bacterium]MCF7814849.1 hypothetical protein [Candidatus Cloacimonadota bacterium]MCF7867905.1 hypothetical protein [Candidatus Cloacimonadota bacterium]MCF7883724.1 hypothetical protein [Candidatus Cloacimonadota bacterium]
MKKITLISFFLIFIVSLSAFEYEFKNKLTLSGRLFEESSRQRYHLNANYKPNLFVTFFQNESFSIDTEQTAELYYYKHESDLEENSEHDIELYRSWLRFSALQYEIRLGLQKINFGTAQILRPLQWFDTINPTDPQKNSEGAESLLFRYYFLNNANLWIWGIKPDKDGTSVAGTDLETNGFEFGGRLQYPFKFCEAAFSYHHRNLDDLQWENEDRFGLDCRWDFEIGLWLETMLSVMNANNSEYYKHFFTVGADYSIAVGNGIYLLTEHMFYEFSEEIPTLFQDSYASSVMLSYPVGRLDSASAIVNYNWLTENYNYYFSYSRAYDFLSIYLNFFWNPDFDEYPIPEYDQDGRSVQLLLEMNF